jgi:hypothetical protein
LEISRKNVLLLNYVIGRRSSAKDYDEPSILMISIPKEKSP